MPAFLFSFNNKRAVKHGGDPCCAAVRQPLLFGLRGHMPYKGKALSTLSSVIPGLMREVVEVNFVGYSRKCVLIARKGLGLNRVGL